MTDLTRVCAEIVGAVRGVSDRSKYWKGDCGEDGLFSPTTSIKDAFMVLEKMEKDGYSTVVHYSPERNRYNCSMITPNGYESVNIWDKSRCLAICKACEEAWRKIGDPPKEVEEDTHECPVCLMKDKDCRCEPMDW